MTAFLLVRASESQIVYKSELPLADSPGRELRPPAIVAIDCRRAEVGVQGFDTRSAFK